MASSSYCCLSSSVNVVKDSRRMNALEHVAKELQLAEHSAKIETAPL